MKLNTNKYEVKVFSDRGQLGRITKMCMFLKKKKQRRGTHGEGQ